MTFHFTAKISSTREKLTFVLILLFLVATYSPFFFIQKTYASVIPVYAFLLLNRMSASVSTGGTVCMKMKNTHTTAISNVQVAFPGNGTQGAASFGVNATAGNWTVTTTNLPLGATAWPNIVTATAVSGATVTFGESSNATMTTNTVYCFNFASASTLTTPTSANSSLTGTIQATDTTAANSELANIAVADLTSGTDQITVTATVAPTFSFSLSSNTFALGTVTSSSGGTSATAITATVTTNAGSGWTTWVEDANNGTLTSAATGGTIGTAAQYVNNSSNLKDLTATTGFYLDAITGTNAPSIDAAYSGTATNSDSTSGGYLSSNFQRIAFQTAPANASTFTIAARARILATAPAATDYTDTLTLTASGQF